MLNEWQEFLDYAEPVEYRASSKKDTTWLGRLPSRPCGTSAA